MNFDIEEEHFTVFNLLLLLLAWSASCNFLYIIKMIFPKLPIPTLIMILTFLCSLALALVITFITIYISIKWVRHHNFGWWLLLIVASIVILSIGLEISIKSIMAREQMFNQEYVR